MSVQQVNVFICKINRATEPIENMVLKIGGSPVFSEKPDWPICKQCGQNMDFLAQIPLSDPIPFSKTYQMAYIFMCPGSFDQRGWLQCDTWDPVSGANKVILQNYTGTTFIPETVSEYPDYFVTLTRSKEPLIDTADYKIEDDLHDIVSDKTKIGGVPLWLQTNETPKCPVCNGAMIFVAQLDAELDGSLPAQFTNKDLEYYNFLHFGGDDGIGYVFLCKRECTSEGITFQWQCT